jgi:hypothetical protein
MEHWLVRRETHKGGYTVNATRAGSTRVALPFIAGNMRRLCSIGAATVALVSVGMGASSATAEVITSTITGIVGPALDSGVFGSPPGTKLMGQGFKLIFTFDDAIGTGLVFSVDGALCGTRHFVSQGVDSGTAVLEIGNGRWIFGEANGAAARSVADRQVGPCENAPSMTFLATDSTSTVGDSVGGTIYFPSSAIPLAYYNWEDSFSYSLLPTDGQHISFNITAPNRLAKGELYPNNITVSGRQPVSYALKGLEFIPMTPCRVVDTQGAFGPLGGPELTANTSREFDLPRGDCSIPNTAVAYSLNSIVVPKTTLGFITIWPSGRPRPVASTSNSDGRIKVNSAIVSAGSDGGVSVFVTDSSHVILDINGYFIPAGTKPALAYYPLFPCRLLDTRNRTGPLGGPEIAGGKVRNFPIQSGSCGIPFDAEAYSLNITAIPTTALGNLVVWPSGQPEPLLPTLVSPDGSVAANAAIVAAGTNNGSLSISVSDDSDVVVDINGYFALPISANGLSFYVSPPCRTLDTRYGDGAFDALLDVDIEGGPCAPPSTAKSYVLNATAIPLHKLGHLTLWGSDERDTAVSTLNSSDGVVVSNMAIVTTLNGRVTAWPSDPTELVLDLFGYFAP